MAELPLLLFPQSSTQVPSKRRGGGADLVKPSAAEQKARHDGKFREILNSFQDLTSSIRGLEPEQVIVLETIGESVERLVTAARQIAGLEWLTEIELEDSEPGEGFRFAEEKDAGKKLGRRLYALMSNQQAMARLVSLWNAWCADPEKRAKSKFGPFKHIFAQLNDVRRWSARDRLEETCVVPYWEDRLRYEKGSVRFEVELWCRGDPIRRRVAYDNLRKLIEAAGGQCIAHALVPDVLYYGVLAELPAARIREKVDEIMSQTYSQLLRCEDVMFFRPHGQSAVRGHVPREEGEGDTVRRGRAAVKGPPKGDPVVALVDGLPLERHQVLKGRMVIDDEDDHGSRYKPQQQIHGTGMASLILRGDLSRDEEPLHRPIYVRPIFIPYEDFDRNVWEKTPDDKLLVDVVHRAVLRIVAEAPSVKVVNLSIGNSWQPFYRQLSPLARLLDWLAWKYKLLFLVSAGNQDHEIVPDLPTADLSTVSNDDLIARTLEALRNSQVDRRPFSPAEAMNVLTVGAVHADGSTCPNGDRRIDLLPGAGLPSPLCTVASGFNRSIKPDVLFPGGRQLYTQSLSTALPPRFKVATSTRPPGVCVAFPGTRPGELNRTAHSRGTSNATALAARTAALVFERLMLLGSEQGGERLTDDYVAVILKALLAHGASWGKAAQTIEQVFGATVTEWREMLRLKGRFLGHGEVDPQRALFSTDERVLMLGWDSLADEEAHEYRVPLPPSLSGKATKRRLTVTLAWFTPINPWHKDYRKAQLWFTPDNKPLALEKTDLDAEHSRRGTLQHQVFEGHKVRAFDDGDILSIKVSCAHDAGALEDRVPYAIAATLEIAENVNLPIFNEIRARILLRPKVETKTT
jgi:hypothetical protein